MSEDRSLDDFASTGSDEEETAGSGSAGTDPTEADSVDDDPAEADATATDPAPTDPADVDPAESTSTWTTDGADCDRCGATVSRRWHDEGDLVCADCADW
ncbi:hypothetical protein SAMN04488066_11531 [Halorubrum aquaticum]|uniref:DUF7573 domain-containing protein n=1 Tax=Halorubrum aquaticum TaxID=387340 RepID=A0A1I3BTB3_9EURY|nr:hypothetical protein [Halorubrum aquaticum]SFH65410.1 hypothetical protein SAMN04488066_11531 [Halorubrum aquaticum]